MENKYASALKFTKKYIYSGIRKYDRALIERIIMLACDPKIKNIVIDGFCGLGGVTGGFNKLPDWMTIVCLNHWDVAIETHAKNHPDCLHLQEDFRTADLLIVLYMCEEIRLRNPGVTVHVWLSLECTNFSGAKGGQSREADSRTLADHADRYVIEINPDVVWIENVREFELWGPMVPKVVSHIGTKKQTVYVQKGFDEIAYYNLLISNGHVLTCPLIVNKKEGTLSTWLIPDPDHKGEDYFRWRDHICSLGYDVERKLLNCADFGVPQHRIRLIMQFVRRGNKARWPVRTHDKHGRHGLLKWLPVKDCLDLHDEGDSVLAFKTEKGKLVPRIESPATIERLINGAIKHVLPYRSSDPWIVKPNSAKNNTDVSAGSSVETPGPTVTCFNGFNLAKAHLVDHYYGNGYAKPITETSIVTGTKDGAALHTLHFLGTYHSTGDGSSIESPSPATMTKDKHPLFTAHFVMDTQFDHVGHSLNEVAKTVTANRKHYYLVNFQWFNQTFSSIDNPSNTIIARLDKAPNYLITLETGEMAIEVFENDPPHYVRLKKFMAENGIISINMRMLKEIELLRIMTIPEDTKLSKSSTANKKMIGNAVPSKLVEMLGNAWSEAA